MKLLRLTPAASSSSASYQQFSLGFQEIIDQTLCSLHKHNVVVDKKIKVFHGDGSIFKMLKLLKDLVKKNEFDLVHIHNGLTGIIFILAMFPFRLALLKKTIFTLHTSYNLLSLRNKILVTLTMFFVSKVCPCSTSSLNSIPRWLESLIQKKLFLIVNGFNYERIDLIKSGNIPNALFSKDCGLKLVCVGSLNDNKNQASILSAVDNLTSRGELIFLGDGPNRKSLEAFTKKLNTKINIVFKGQIPRCSAIEHMLEADILVSLSKGEGMPISVLEAMYSDCFVILSDIPPHREICPPAGTCIFVDADKSIEFVEALNFCQENIGTIRSNLPLARTHVLHNFSVRSMLASYYRIYQMLLDQSK